MTDTELRQLYQTIHTIAAVGFSKDPDKPAGFIPEYLMSLGYHVIPVNPSASEIAGQKAYPDLLSIPEQVDVVQIFRASDQVPPIVEQAIQIGAKVVWMQEGIVNPVAAERARAAGLQVMMDHCMMKEHRRLFGT